MRFIRALSPSSLDPARPSLFIQRAAISERGLDKSDLDTYCYVLDIYQLHLLCNSRSNKLAT